MHVFPRTDLVLNCLHKVSLVFRGSSSVVLDGGRVCFLPAQIDFQRDRREAHSVAAQKGRMRLTEQIALLKTLVDERLPCGSKAQVSF